MTEQLFREERLMRIMEMIHKDGKVVVSELARIFDLSKPSIRLDLADLENQRADRAHPWRRHPERCQHQ